MTMSIRLRSATPGPFHEGKRPIQPGFSPGVPERVRDDTEEPSKKVFLAAAAAVATGEILRRHGAGKSKRLPDVVKQAEDVVAAAPGKPVPVPTLVPGPSQVPIAVPGTGYPVRAIVAGLVAGVGAVGAVAVATGGFGGLQFKAPGFRLGEPLFTP